MTVPVRRYGVLPVMPAKAGQLAHNDDMRTVAAQPTPGALTCRVVVVSSLRLPE
jgi:hypothetical protein